MGSMCGWGCCLAEAGLRANERVSMPALVLAEHEPATEGTRDLNA